jgi:hypothetical protein
VKEAKWKKCGTDGEVSESLGECGSVALLADASPNSEALWSSPRCVKPPDGSTGLGKARRFGRYSN